MIGEEGCHFEQRVDSTILISLSLFLHTLLDDPTRDSHADQKHGEHDQKRDQPP
jgi:hypothetical protein